MNPLQLSFAFSAGIAAALNPCGVAILPSYISYILTKQGQGGGCRLTASKALGGITAGLSMTAGFFTIFGLFGILFSLLGQIVISAVAPWFSLLVGGGLILLGILHLFDHDLFDISLIGVSSRLESKGEGGCLRPFYFYGLGYALASLGCTLPIFLMIVSQSLVSGSYLLSVMVFLSYVTGMGLVVIGISVATRLFREALENWLGKLLPYVKKIAGVIIVAAGIYLIYFSISSGFI